MVYFYFMISLFGMIFGHIFKSKRWGLLISIYETPSQKKLLRALATGHTINALIPFRVGDFIRIYLSGKELYNGYPLALATVIADLYIDFICVGSIFYILIFLDKGGTQLLEVANSFMLLGFVVISFTFFCIIFRKLFKKIIQSTAVLLSAKYEFPILYITYLTIASLKDIFLNINKFKFFEYSICMWSGYLLSYICFAKVTQELGFTFTASDVFTTIFSSLTYRETELSGSILFVSFLFLPLIACWLYSKIPDGINELKRRPTLPHISETDRATFLKMYYADENRKNLKLYLEMNQDVVVIRDNSAGSNATTITALKGEKLIYRKYVFNLDGKKLVDQISWIEKYQRDLPLPLITNKKNSGNIVAYDMPQFKGCVSFYDYINTAPIHKSWDILLNVINDLKRSIYLKNIKKLDHNSLKEYIKFKVEDNISRIKLRNSYISILEKNFKIKINGEEYHTLGFYSKIFSNENLIEIFKNDYYSEIHGDLTVDNIVCVIGEKLSDLTEYATFKKPDKYYLIDPNVGNIHESPNLDFAKILQSLHGNYEILTNASLINIEHDSINFSVDKNENYLNIYQIYKRYLKDNFNPEEIRSIYHHEMIHWLRLVPHQIEKNEYSSVVFYAGLLFILRDLYNLEYEN